eukprot:2779853-Amphidinium_carterae.1
MRFVQCCTSARSTALFESTTKRTEPLGESTSVTLARSLSERLQSDWVPSTSSPHTSGACLCIQESGRYPFSAHLAGKRRLWEIRLQVAV